MPSLRSPPISPILKEHYFWHSSLPFQSYPRRERNTPFPQIPELPARRVPVDLLHHQRPTPSLSSQTLLAGPFLSHTMSTPNPGTSGFSGLHALLTTLPKLLLDAGPSSLESKATCLSDSSFPPCLEPSDRPLLSKATHSSHLCPLSSPVRFPFL